MLVRVFKRLLFGVHMKACICRLICGLEAPLPPRPPTLTQTFPIAHKLSGTNGRPVHLRLTGREKFISTPPHNMKIK